MREWERMLADIKAWAIEAGEEQIRRFNQPMNLQYKSAEIDIVTEVDVWTEKFLIEKINNVYPKHRIISEESGFHHGEDDYEWVIDPIDGTTNFAHGFPLFSISIAVKYNDETVLGVVYIPMLGEMYETMKGYGAKLNGKTIQVSKIKRLPLAMVATGFPYDRASDPKNNLDNFNNVITKVAGIRQTGSAAIDLCQVAAGRFDGYWEIKLNSWDIEAGLLIVKEAGGFVRREEQDKGIFVLVGNESIFDALNQLIEIKR